ncbi:MAG: hypothetical protein VB060_05925 [Oscillibacter sp.]|nr:hypothetical protein [Oscillibacter sp.]MEA4993362.1 hypothetical protein [Oscillibacter sp.]
MSTYSRDFYIHFESSDPLLDTSPIGSWLIEHYGAKPVFKNSYFIPRDFLLGKNPLETFGFALRDFLDDRFQAVQVVICPVSEMLQILFQGE